jgi:hypothetical protein
MSFHVPKTDARRVLNGAELRIAISSVEAPFHPGESCLGSLRRIIAAAHGPKELQEIDLVSISVSNGQ